jgi:hypothetical protein
MYAINLQGRRLSLLTHQAANICSVIHVFALIVIRLTKATLYVAVQLHGIEY